MNILSLIMKSPGAALSIAFLGAAALGLLRIESLKDDLDAARIEAEMATRDAKEATEDRDRARSAAEATRAQAEALIASERAAAERVVERMASIERAQDQCLDQTLPADLWD